MFLFANHTEVHFGAGVLQTINVVLKYTNYHSIDVVASNYQVENGVTVLLESLLGNRVKAVVSNIEANHTVDNVDHIDLYCDTHQADLIIAAGGGSAMDAPIAA